MASKTTVLITGAGRGLGYYFAEKYLARPNYMVVGAVRNPSTATALKALPTGEGSSLIVVKIDAISETDPVTAIEQVKAFGINSLDIVIANAGMVTILPKVHEVKIPDFLDHLQVNLFGVIRLFKAVHPLLVATDSPKFITLGTSAASMSEMETRNFPNAVYGASKAALNYITLKTHYENPKLIAFPLDPGWVQTDMGNTGAWSLGLEKAEIEVDVSISGMINVIDNSSREATSGKFMVYDGTSRAW